MSTVLRGVGDVVEIAARMTGVKAAVQVVEKITGKPCGCEKRRDRMNKLMPFRGEDHASATEHDEHDSADGGGDSGSR
jgi:hypothetical protein